MRVKFLRYLILTYWKVLKYHIFNLPYNKHISKQFGAVHSKIKTYWELTILRLLATTFHQKYATIQVAEIMANII